MELAALIAKLDTDTAAFKPKTVDMTKAQFGAYAADQLAKGKAEAADEKTKDKAEKRLAHLDNLVSNVAKAEMWEGLGNTMSIPVYEGGFESDLTVRSEQSDTTINMESLSQLDGSAFANGAATFKAMADAINGLTPAQKAKADDKDPKKDETAKAADDFAWPADVANKDFMKGEVQKRAEDWGLDSVTVPR